MFGCSSKSANRRCVFCCDNGWWRLFDLHELTKHRPMLRISPIDSGNHRAILRLEGRVAGPWVAELRTACEKVLGEGRTLDLNLAEVSFLDQAGVGLLANVRARGVQLRECSPFVAEQLKSNGGQPQGEAGQGR
jgi:ABC-type transporter Mla MlaB component